MGKKGSGRMADMPGAEAGLKAPAAQSVGGRSAQGDLASGFVERPTVLPGGCTIMYHARVGEGYRLFTVKRRGC